VVRLHAAPTYHLYFIGFTPGLPYMTGMPERLHLPRLPSPRTKVPPGSVGIGGIQCCIYSVESPGGYWILGRTPLRLYDPDGPEPILLRAGIGCAGPSTAPSSTPSPPPWPRDASAADA
jgi:inhibitor of KinA